jgi:8-demethyl-8-alpha-L-rhamnosyltetracenomycin-C 2'-O-methyltransferase
MSTLTKISEKYDTSKRTELQCAHYSRIYERYFSALRERPLTLLEIGVLRGESLKMWEEYFPNAEIYGVDIDISRAVNNIIHSEHPRIKLTEFNQENIAHHRSLIHDIIKKPLDIVIDDGSHKNAHQILSFREIFPYVSSGGIYVIEDLCTSYWSDPIANSGLSDPRSAISYLKELVDNVNYELHRGVSQRPQPWGNLPPIESDIMATYLDRHILGLHFYKGMCLIEKK